MVAGCSLRPFSKLVNSKIACQHPLKSYFDAGFTEPGTHAFSVDPSKNGVTGYYCSSISRVVQNGTRDNTSRASDGPQETRSSFSCECLHVPGHFTSKCCLSVSPLPNQVLEIEPWNSARHVSGRAAAWGDCGRRAGLLKDKGKANAHKTVQQRVYRLARQLNDSTSGFLWKGYPEVTERVVKVAAKLRVDSDLKGTLGPDRMQGLVEHRASNPATPERPRAIAEQRQQLQGPEVPGAYTELQVALRSFVAAAERASHSAMAC